MKKKVAHLSTATEEFSPDLDIDDRNGQCEFLHALGLRSNRPIIRPFEIVHMPGISRTYTFVYK